MLKARLLRLKKNTANLFQTISLTFFVIVSTTIILAIVQLKIIQAHNHQYKNHLECYFENVASMLCFNVSSSDI